MSGSIPFSLFLSLFLSFSAVHRTQDGKQRIPFTNSTANYVLTSRGFTPVWMRSQGLRAPPPQGLRLNRHLVCSGCSAPPLSLAPSFPLFSLVLSEDVDFILFHLREISGQLRGFNLQLNLTRSSSRVNSVFPLRSYQRYRAF